MAETEVREVACWVAEAGRREVTVLTGAGISTESGVPDFRGPAGLWTRDPSLQRLFDYAAYVGDAELRRQAWSLRRAHPAWSAEPNAGHRALATLETSGRLRAIVTQNIDGLHQRAGNSPRTVLEIHGTLYEVECLSCGRLVPTPAVLARLDAGEDDPACTACGGILKVATIAFGQALKTDVLDAAIDAATGCAVFLAVGTSLTVQPAASLVALAARAGARLVIVNAEPTPYDELAAAVLRAPIGEVLPLIVPGAIVPGAIVPGAIVPGTHGPEATA